ncbi:MAG: hypothetical protein IT376_16825 [Polyangiaceae bacterium]|nr:hypothetical protein [Polyangiaceae bacterium]
MKHATFAMLVAGAVLGCSGTGGDEGKTAPGRTPTGGAAGTGGGTSGDGAAAGGSGGLGSGGGSASGGTGGGLILDGGGTSGTGASGTGGAAAGGTGATDSGAGGSGGTACAIDGGSGTVDPTQYTPTAEACGNGLDDDQNGFVDEGCTCSVGATQACYSGVPPLAGVGACARGTQTCQISGEFGQWGPCAGSGAPGVEVCEGAADENCNGLVDESCGCCSGEVRECGIAQGACTLGSQTCEAGVWGACSGGTPGTEVCNDQADNDCDGQVDEGCVIDLTVNLDGDCLTASCPPQAPYPIGCNVVFSGGDHRGCVANAGGSLVYFQEGDACGAGNVSGTLTCSSQPGAPLSAANCAINKSTKYYPPTPSGCPDT